MRGLQGQPGVEQFWELRHLSQEREWVCEVVGSLIKKGGEGFEWIVVLAKHGALGNSGRRDGTGRGGGVEGVTHICRRICATLFLFLAWLSDE